MVIFCLVLMNAPACFWHRRYFILFGLNPCFAFLMRWKLLILILQFEWLYVTVLPGGSNGTGRPRSCLKNVKTPAASNWFLAKTLGTLLYCFINFAGLGTSNTSLMGNIQHKAIPLKLKRLACDHERFLWALSIVRSRSVNMKMRMGAFIQDANVLAPYAGTCFLVYSSFSYLLLFSLY